MGKFFKENLGMFLTAVLVLGGIWFGIWWVEASLAGQEVVR